MEKVLVIGVTSIGIALLLAIPGIALGYWLQRSHAAPNRAIASVFVCIVAVLIKTVWLTNLPYDVLVLFALLGSTLGVYQLDIYWAFNKTRPHD